MPAALFRYMLLIYAVFAADAVDAAAPCYQRPRRRPPLLADADAFRFHYFAFAADAMLMLSYKMPLCHLPLFSRLLRRCCCLMLYGHSEACACCCRLLIRYYFAALPRAAVYAAHVAAAAIFSVTLVFRLLRYDVMPLMATALCCCCHATKTLLLVAIRLMLMICCWLPCCLRYIRHDAVSSYAADAFAA